tara:strand:+ start:652 stop:3639 length:2988 start_codon:yes stop_codon:yes gene_type:complete
MAKATDEYRIKFGIDGRDQLGKFKIELSQLNKQLADVLKKKAKHKGADAASAKQVGNLTKKIERQKNAIKLQNQALTKNTATTKKNTAAQKKQTTSVAGSLKNFAKMAAAVTGAIAVVRRLTGFIGANVKAFADYEKGVKNVLTLMNSDDTGLFSGNLYKGSLQLAKDFGLGLKDVNKAMFNAVSAGISGGDAIQFLNESSKLAIAGVTDLKSSTMGLTTVLNAYGLEASEASKITDILFTTQKFGVTTVAELSKSLGVVVPFAAASGISIEELGAAIATTTRSGLDAAKSVTALRAAISQMQKPASASRDLFVKYGIPIGAAQMKAVGFTETLKRLNNVYKTSPRDIELMFGNVRGLTAIFSLAGDNASTYNEVLAENQDETLRAANTQKALEENMDSSQFALDRFSASWSNLKVAMGDSDFIKEKSLEIADFFDILASEDATTWQKTQAFFLQFSGAGALGINADELAELAQTVTDQGLKNQADVFMKSQQQLEGFRDKTSAIRAKMLGGENNFTNDELLFMKSFLGAPTLEGFNSELDSYAKSYREHLAKMKVLDDADNLKISNEKDRRADLAQKYDAFELQSRENLSSQIKTLNEIDLTDKESRANTDLSIIQAKIQKERNLLAAMSTFEIDNDSKRIAIQTRLDKLETQAKKKSLQIRNTNTDAFNLEEAAITKKFQEDKTSNALKQAKTRNLTNKQFRIQNITDEIAYQEKLLLIAGSTDAEKEKIRGKISNLNVQLAQASFKEEENLEKIKVDLALKGISFIAEARKKALETELANQERAIQKRKDMVNQESSDGLINQRQAADEKKKLDKEAFEARKENELKMAKISLMQELANIAVAAAANPGNPFTFGAAGAAQYTIQAALALARYATSSSAIKAQEFAKGGMVHGKSHAQGGERFAVGGRVVELEGGEAVINKKSTSMFGGALSAMNVAGGGTSFGSPNFGSSGLIDYEALGNVIGRNTNVVLPVESLNKTQKRVKMLESSAKF